MSPAALRGALIAATTALALSSTGDVFALAALLGLLAADVAAWGGATLVAVAVFARWGTSSLRAVSGAQAVLGAAGLVGPTRAAVACWLMAGAIVFLSPGGAPALAFGSTAALLVAGPTIGAGAGALVLRAAAVVAGVVAAYAVGRWVPVRLARWGALASATAAVVLALPGGLS